MIGRTISHYRITERLGEGAMGIVYKAEDTKLKRPVALKFLASHVLGDSSEKERFLREAQAAAALDHPNICAVHEIDEFDGRIFIVMAYIEGQTLKDKIASGLLKLEEALDIAAGIARGLQEAHEHKTVHRDIKSANIMVTPKGEPKITDFGLAYLADRSKLTKSGTTLGTPVYMSPEQAQGQTADRRSDVWSLGFVLYEMLAGELPFDAEYEQVIIYDIINEPHEPVTGRRAGLPLELDRILAKALAKAPAERYQHADDLLVDLRRLCKALEARKTREVTEHRSRLATASQAEGELPHGVEKPQRTPGSPEPSVRDAKEQHVETVEGRATLEPGQPAGQKARMPVPIALVITGVVFLILGAALGYWFGGS